MKRTTISTLALFFIFVFLAVPLATLHTEAATAASVSWEYYDPRFGIGEELLPSELVRQLTGEDISEAEASYLDRMHRSFYVPDKGISNACLSLAWEGDVLLVRASDYGYTAQNGTKVVWSPVSVPFGEDSVPMTETPSGAEVRLPRDVLSDSEHVTVQYICRITLAAEDVNALLSLAYNDATAAMRDNEAYLDAMRDYYEAYEAYMAYLEAMTAYESDVAAYETYQESLAAYEVEKKEYAAYLTAKAAYDTKQKEYEEYLEACRQYDIDKENYDKAYEQNGAAAQAYREYLVKINSIKAQMYAIENIYKKPALDGSGTLFKALQNKEMVALFEEYRDLLSRTYGIDPGLIDQMNDSADELNVYLQEYAEIREISDEAAFAYYAEHYERITELFNTLYDRMMSIMTPVIFKHICALVEVKYDKEMASYKKWRIKNVLAQIYLAARCLDDTKRAEGTWAFFSDDGRAYTYHFSDLMDGNLIISDTNNASVEGVTWPTPVDKVVLPDIPQRPTEVAKPLAPTPMEEPIPPTPVPTPVRPDEVLRPEPPAVSGENALYTAGIVGALASGTLTERPERTEDAVLSFTATVQKRITENGEALLTVYGGDRRTVLSEAEWQGEALSSLLPSEPPTREADDRYTYTFLSWSLSPYERVPLEQATAGGDICVYALYTATPRSYTVTWVTPAGTVSAPFSYGQTPVFSGNTAKPATHDTVYDFCGWDPPVAPVRGDVIYEAQYTESVRLYTVTWQWRGGEAAHTYEYGATPSAPYVTPEERDGTELYRFIGWSEQVGEVRSNVTYIAQYQRTVLASAERGVTLSLYGNGYVLSSASPKAELAGLVQLAAAEGRRLTLTLDGITLTAEKETVAALAEAGLKTLELDTTRREDVLTALVLTLLDADGRAVSADGVRIRLVGADAAGEGLALYAVRENGVRRLVPFTADESGLVFAVTDLNRFELTRRYAVTLKTDKNGNAVLSHTTAMAGETLSFLVYPADGYRLASAVMVRADTGEEITLGDAKSFEMPACPITLRFAFEEIMYTVRFVVDGKEIAAVPYRMGDTVTPPEVELSFERDGFIYTFMSWSPMLGLVTGDVTYTAMYHTIKPEYTAGIGEADAMATVAKDFALPMVCVVLFIVMIVLALVLVGKKRKQRKAKRKLK